MEHRGFFRNAGPFSLARVAEAAGAELCTGVAGTATADPARLVHDVRALSDAGPEHVSFLDNRKYLAQMQATGAGACLVLPAFKDRVPAGTAALVTRAPYHGFALALALFYPDAQWPKVARAGGMAGIDPAAQLEDGVLIEPGVIVGPEAHIGRGTRLAAGAVIGERVHIGRNCYIGATATVTHALIGDRVILHAGVRIGQDGFGFAMGPRGHLKVPQIGRVIIQDDVEIGANSAVDRGALKDTIIGEGSKIDNLVQIGHNVVMGRHCVIAGHVGIAGSAELGDFVVMGGQSGTVGHVKIGTGAQIGGAAHAKNSIAPGERVLGTPAKPIRVFAREIATLARLAERRLHQDGKDDEEKSEA